MTEVNGGESGGGELGGASGGVDTTGGTGGRSGRGGGAGLSSGGRGSGGTAGMPETNDFGGASGAGESGEPAVGGGSGGLASGGAGQGGGGAAGGAGTSAGIAGATTGNGGTAGGNGGTAGGNGGTAGGVSAAGGAAGASGGAAGASGAVEGATRACCRGGTQTFHSGTWGACAGAYISAESCNGLDDDCNGEVDEMGAVTCGIGACARTIAACTAGAVSACVPGTPATGPDGCDGIDNDCDGAVDEDCSACVHVAASGDDGAAASSNGATPFLNVQPALDFAASHRSVATRVCVAAGPACGATATFNGPSGADLTLHDGIDLLANYESTSWTRCTTSTTTLAPQTGRGVVFPASVATRTVLDGFVIARFADTMTAGVTVDGAHGALLSNLNVTGGPTVATSYGVNVVSGAEATVFHSNIDAGTATSEMVAVRASGATVALEDNCAAAPDPTTGRCTALCTAGGPSVSASAAGVQGSPPPTRINAVLLENAPGSRIERSTVCTHEDPLATSSNDLAAIHVLGDATDVVLRANSVQAQLYFNTGSTNPKVALLLEACAGATPRISDNDRLELAPLSMDETDYEGIHVAGDCHPVFDSNRELGVYGDSWRYASATGLRCVAAGGVASRCVLARNGIAASFGASAIGSFVPSNLTGYGLSCEGGSCTRIEENTITGASSNFSSSSSAFTISGTGAYIDSTRVFIAGNQITGLGGDGHCSVSATGLGVVGPARIENNVVLGMAATNTCSNGFQSATGLSASAADVSSNYIAAIPSGCFGTRAGTGTPLAASGGGGSLFRNNILVAGSCGIAFQAGSTPPAAFEHNALSPMLYVDNGTQLTTAVQVDALTDTLAGGTLAGTCTATSDHHLLAGSLCIDAGTTTGAPPHDRDGDARDTHPDIGPDEYVP